MQPPKTLRLKAAGTAMVPYFEKLSQGVRQFVGREMQKVSAEGQPEEWGFAPTAEAVEVPYRAEYVEAVKAGDLTPADKATADACGVSFGASKPQKDGDK
jgi:hypothetical protein